MQTVCISINISILSLYAEGDDLSKALAVDFIQFQSSPSMQRETFIKKHIFYILKYFNPLPLCRGRLLFLIQIGNGFFISILSLYAEGDAAHKAA